MDRREFVSTIAAGLLAGPLSAQAQQTGTASDRHTVERQSPLRIHIPSF